MSGCLRRGEGALEREVNSRSDGNSDAFDRLGISDNRVFDIPARIHRYRRFTSGLTAGGSQRKVAGYPFLSAGISPATLPPFRLAIQVFRILYKENKNHSFH